MAWSQSCVYTESPSAHIDTPTTTFALAVDAQRAHSAFLGHGLGVGFVHCALTWATMGTVCMCREGFGGVLPGLLTFERVRDGLGRVSGTSKQLRGAREAGSVTSCLARIQDQSPPRFARDVVLAPP